jgi:hypothetical protein
MDKSIIELLEYIPEEEWNKIKLKLESRAAFRKAEILSAKRKATVEISDWILSKGLLPSYNEDGVACWTIPDGSGKTLKSSDLYGEYIRDLMDEIDYSDDEEEDEEY